MEHKFDRLNGRDPTFTVIMTCTCGQMDKGLHIIPDFRTVKQLWKHLVLVQASKLNNAAKKLQKLEH